MAGDNLRHRKLSLAVRLRARVSSNSDPEALLRNVPSRSYPFGGTQLHGTHTLGHFSGRVWCFTCACSFSVTGPRVPPSLLGPCTGHTTEDTAKRNVYCLAKGELPAAWRAGGWPLGPEAGLLHFAV